MGCHILYNYIILHNYVLLPIVSIYSYVATAYACISLLSIMCNWSCGMVSTDVNVLWIFYHVGMQAMLDDCSTDTSEELEHMKKLTEDQKAEIGELKVRVNTLERDLEQSKWGHNLIKNNDAIWIYLLLLCNTSLTWLWSAKIQFTIRKC